MAGALYVPVDKALQLGLCLDSLGRGEALEAEAVAGAAGPGGAETFDWRCGAGFGGLLVRSMAFASALSCFISLKVSS